MQYPAAQGQAVSFLHWHRPSIYCVLKQAKHFYMSNSHSRDCNIDILEETTCNDFPSEKKGN